MGSKRYIFCLWNSRISTNGLESIMTPRNTFLIIHLFIRIFFFFLLFFRQIIVFLSPNLVTFFIIFFYFVDDDDDDNISHITNVGSLYFLFYIRCRMTFIY